MLVTCPKCECKARFASSKAINKETREAYWQCMKLNCGTHTSVGKIVEPTRCDLSPELQLVLGSSGHN